MSFNKPRKPLRVLGMELPQVRFYDHYLSLPSLDWFGRLLDPDWIRETLPEATVDWLALSEWSNAELPVPLVHPGCLPNNEEPIERLLGISRDELEAIAYGQSQLTAAWLHERLREIELPSAPKKDEDHRDVHLRNLAQRGARPEWMILVAVPLPPASLLNEDAASKLSVLQERVSKLARLIELRAPSMLIESQSGILQHEFDMFFRAMVESLRERHSPKPMLAESSTTSMHMSIEDGHLILAPAQGTFEVSNRSERLPNAPIPLRLPLDRITNVPADGDGFLEVLGDFHETPYACHLLQVRPVSLEDATRVRDMLRQRGIIPRFPTIVSAEELALREPGALVEVTGTLRGSRFSGVELQNIPIGLQGAEDAALRVIGFLYPPTSSGGPKRLWGMSVRRAR